jgi:Dolichyl-phosphate-mannose-protein mannosyltransferase
MKQRFSNKTFLLLLLLLLLSGLLFVLNIWGYPLIDVDEPRYAETAREMLTRAGDWITPHFNGMVRFDKPALFYWLIALSYKLFGISAFSARLVSALAATLSVLMLFLFIKHVLNRQAGLLTAVIFATMLGVFLLGRWAITDMTLSCCMLGTWLSLYLVLTLSPKWYLPAGLFAGLGMLTKGPVALALPGITFLIALGWFYRARWRLLFSPWAGIGLILFIAIAAPWYIAIAKANPGTFVGSFFFLHNVERFTHTVSGHKGPWFFYIPVLLIGSFPWCLFLPALLYRMVQLKGKLPEFVRYAAIWFGVTFLFFSAAGTKLPTYILPGLPALAILLGWYPTASEQTKKERWLYAPLWLVTGALLVLIRFFGLHPYQFIPQSLQILYNPRLTLILLSVLLITFLCSSLWIYTKKATLKGLLVMGCGMIVVYTGIALAVLPEVAGILQNDMVCFARRAVGDKKPLAVFKLKKPSLVFYTQKHLFYALDPEEATLHDRAAIKTLHFNNQALYLIVENQAINHLRHVYPVTPVQTGQVYSLFQTDTVNIAEDINQ